MLEKLIIINMVKWDGKSKPPLPDDIVYTRQKVFIGDDRIWVHDKKGNAFILKPGSWVLTGVNVDDRSDVRIFVIDNLRQLM